MLCEKCSQEIDALTCAGCGKSVRELGPFCYHCGRELHEHTNPSGATGGSPREDSADTIDFSTRVLCSDGACIGVINEQGTCRVCGKPYAPES